MFDRGLPIVGANHADEPLYTVTIKTRDGPKEIPVVVAVAVFSDETLFILKDIVKQTVKDVLDERNAKAKTHRA